MSACGARSLIPLAWQRGPRAINPSRVDCDLRLRRRHSPARMPCEAWRPPVVLVDGFLGRGDTFSGAVPPGVTRPCHSARLGPVSSLHDRVCELFYQIKGGRVDFGADHAAAHGHAQHGATHAGLVPEWDAEHPVHLFGHSLGGNTIALLQCYLSEQRFAGHCTSADWIASMTTVSSPLRGTTTAYILGAREGDPGGVHAFSVGSILTRIIHLYEYADIGPLKQRISLHLDHWGLSRRHPSSSFASFVRAMLLRCPVGDSVDNAAWDLTIEGMARIHAAHPHTPHPRTAYRSYVTCATRALPATQHHAVPDDVPCMAPLRLLARAIGQRKMGDAVRALLPAGEDERDWWPNDGVVSVVSQAHPHAECDDAACAHGKAEEGHEVLMGRWRVISVDGIDHNGLVEGPASAALLKEYFEYIDRVDAHRDGRGDDDPGHHLAMTSVIMAR